MRQIKSSAAPRERVVHEYGVAPTSQVVGRSPTGVVGSTKPNSTRVRVITEINQLLSANRTDAAMAVQTKHARQAAAYPRRAQQPSRDIRPITHGPPKPANLNPIYASTSLIVHSRSRTGLAQAQYPTQRGGRRVHSDVGPSRSYDGRPVLIAGNRVRAIETLLHGFSGQLGTPRRRAGPRHAPPSKPISTRSSNVAHPHPVRL